SPRRLLTRSTHDSKRSADLRARLSVLPETSEHWLAATEEMASDPAVASTGLDAQMQLFAWQALLGIWPERAPAASERDEIGERMRTHLHKAAREAKLHTTWIDNDTDYDAQLDRFVDAVLDGPAAGVLTRLAAEIGPAARSLSLARTLLHLASPGIPDISQGEEMRRCSLVDPDNRRPVDFDRRVAALRRPAGAGGPGKLQLVRTLLAERRRRPALFLDGSYTALDAAGAVSQQVFAFARSHDE